MRLGRAVVIAGQIGCGAAAIGRNLTARTGLPFAEVDRVIEHEAGRSLARLAVEEGTRRLEDRAAAVLRRLVESSPRGVVVLGNVWLPASARPLLRDETHLVHIRRPADFLIERLTPRLERDGDWILGGVAAPIDDEAALTPLLERRRSLLLEAHVVLEAGRAHENTVADLLLDSLERVSSGESL